MNSDPIAAAVRAVMATQTEWTGTASKLLGVLSEQAGERVAKSKTWPDTARALSGRLRRAATFLRKIGIEVTFSKEGRAQTPHDQHHHQPKSPRARNRRDSTVRTARIVRGVHAEIQSGQRLRGSAPVGGSS